ncbi:RluA family pseudouridine synthase [Lactobacillus sp. YT155]|uniref:RluA family pseudouridine synthase n=1 Tax=Lactobacillus sp. YT155 TaxID=3060955 RepID=UPI00265E89B1|nr:RluA family pseudouridine synthase [Lactobacillus sp. YT155]MDO1605639.1 RluA family pseudouridine synthase [Lactobacillus sp. YT155]
MKKTIIYPENEPQTIRELLKQWLIPKKWQHFLRINHQILINDIYQPFNYEIQTGDKISIDFSDLPIRSNQNYLTSTHVPVVVFEDESIIIINKPSGQKSHPNEPQENNTAMNDVEFYLQRTHHHAYMIHRLDMLTSGLMMIAKNPYVVPIMNQQLTKKTFQRHYYAMVDLINDIPDTKIIDLPIAQDPTDPRKRIVSSYGLESITKFSVIKENDSQALLDINLLTGRTHQIRVHLSHLNWPIVGDSLYNPNSTSSKLMLMAYRMEYVEPFSQQKKSIEIKIPTDFTIN